ncbi:MAG: glycoside hydrolase family protein [Polyangiales bacterium]|nr:glycoside hydrolase family protein [Sandaracinaceae bacterium]
MDDRSLSGDAERMPPFTYTRVKTAPCALILPALLAVACSDGGVSPSDAGAADAQDARDGGTDGAISAPSSCKRGIAYGHHTDADMSALQPAVRWWYNWAYQPDAELGSGTPGSLGVEYVPMVWGGTFDAEAMVANIPAGATTLLGFNEPNFGEQSNLSATAAAALWPDVEAIADARGLTLVSPAVNFCGGDCQDTNPFDYLDDFFAACDDCRVDHVAFHIYVGCHPPGDNKAQWLIDHVETYKARFGQPLWLTEFACTDATSFADQVAFLEDAVAYLESEPRIHRYAWFSGRFAGIPYVDLLGADGQLTPLGEAYVDAPANAACTD